MRLSISAIILTYNEEKNIEQCLRSIYDWVDEIFIVDSFSTDKTLEIARHYTDKIYQHEFENQAKQLNWALENLPIRNEWVLRLDADEYITDELKNEIFIKLPSIPENISGIYFKRKVYFLGKWIKHGGYYPTYLLRMWRKGSACCEQRWMDEHMKLIKGGHISFEHDIVDDNKKDIHWWIQKHNNYATREAIEILNLKYKLFDSDYIEPKLTGSYEQRKRWLKEKFYNTNPILLRAFFYYLYRYFFRLGFFDGIEGFIWHFLQGLWYRFLVDVKIYQIEKKAKSENKDIKTVISELYGYNL